MGWKDLSNKEREAVLKRAKRRGLTENDLSSTEDLVVSHPGLTLGQGTDVLRPKVVKPRSFAELIAAVGPPEAARKRALTTDQRVQRDQLARFAREIRPTRRSLADLEEKARSNKRERFSNIAAKMLVGGLISEVELEEWGIKDDLLTQIQQVNISMYLLPNILVPAGTTLTYSGSGPYTVIANKLKVEPGARILIDKVSVTFDCNELIVQ